MARRCPSEPDLGRAGIQLRPDIGCFSTALSRRADLPWDGLDGPVVTRTGHMSQPLPECSSGPGTRSDHELELGMKAALVLKLPQALTDF
jgi:hypothetical protein